MVGGVGYKGIKAIQEICSGRGSSVIEELFQERSSCLIK